MAKQVKAYWLTQDGMKDIPFGAVTRDDLRRWFDDDKDADNPVKYWSRVATLFRCIEIRAWAVSGMPRQIQSEDGRIVAAANFATPQFDDEGAPLIEDNLPFEIDLDDLLWRTEAGQCLLGSAYWHRQRNRMKVTGVRWLDPRTIKPQYDRSSGVRGFVRSLSGMPPLPIAVEDMCWIWRPGIGELGPGIAPAAVAAQNAGISAHMDEFINRFFESGAMPVTIVMAESRPPEPERGRIKAYLERVLMGIGNAFGIEVLSSTLKFEQLTPPLKEMVIPDIKDDAQHEIVVALGVPESLVFSSAANFATAQVDDLNFYTKTIVPEINFIQRQVNKRLLGPLGMRIIFRPDQLEVFQQQELDKVNTAVMLYDRGVIDGDELRQAGGYQPSAGREQEAGENPVQADPPPANDDEARDGERRQWQRKVMKRWPDERPYAIPFEPQYLSPGETAVIRMKLMQARDAEEVKAAFAAPFRPQRLPEGGGRTAGGQRAAAQRRAALHAGD